MKQPGFDGLAQRFARCQQLLLPDELIERTRPHAVGQRSQLSSGA
jgi:hypothetical protein